MSVHNGATIIVNGCAGQITIPGGTYDENHNPHYEGIQFIGGNVPVNLYLPSGAKPHIVHVSGTGGNPFGHTLFWIDPSVGFVHAAAAGVNRVYYIPPQNWDDYAVANQKTILQLVPVPNWEALWASAYLHAKLTTGFHWHIGKHDCSVFAKQLADAGGGGDTGSKSMFPTKAVKRNVERGVADRITW
jgi:hypothetical protein